MELYTYLRDNEIPLKIAAKLLNIQIVTLKKYLVHEREPGLETTLRILKVFGGAVGIEDLMNKRINPQNLREINVKNMPKSKKWLRIKLIQAACRDKNDKFRVQKTYVRNRFNLPEEWFFHGPQTCPRDALNYL